MDTSKFDVNGWYHWSPWSDCSALCGVGVSIRTRDCRTNQQCIGDVIQKKNCLLKKCPETSKY